MNLKRLYYNIDFEVLSRGQCKGKFESEKKTPPNIKIKVIFKFASNRISISTLKKNLNKFLTV